MVLSVFVFLIRSSKKKIGEVLSILMSPILAVMLSWFVKSLIPYAERPFQVNGFPPLTITIPFNTSFPSDHTSVAFALAVSVYLYNKKFGFILLVMALIVGIGRIFSNVHYPVDILGGAMLGSFTALAIDTLLKSKILRKLKLN
jgi:undecaprenyl-diphosphatase